MELDNKIYKKINFLCEKGDKFTGKGKLDKALDSYLSALKLLPEPVYDWEASTWVYCAIGDTYFLMENYKLSMDNFFEAQKCPDGLDNPFVCVRIGECFYELGNIEKAKECLLQAYMLDGEDPFSDADPKYLEAIADLI